MPIKKERFVIAFDENWAPVGTVVHIEGYVGTEVVDRTIGVVKSYTCGGTEMNIRTINGLDVRIPSDMLDNLDVRRMVPEDSNTVDMDYKSLMNSHYGSE